MLHIHLDLASGFLQLTIHEADVDTSRRSATHAFKVNVQGVPRYHGAKLKRRRWRHWLTFLHLHVYSLSLIGIDPFTYILTLAKPELARSSPKFRMWLRKP